MGSLGEIRSHTIEAITPKATQNTCFIPLVGAPTTANSQHHINTLVYRLADRFQGKSLFINAATVQTSPLTAKEIIHSPYFSSITNAWNNIDIAFVGIGGILSTRDSLWRDFLTEEDKQFLKLNDAVGDIFCRFINKEGNIIKGELNDRTIAVSLTQFIRIPDRIGIAEGISKVSAIKALLEKKMITGLITTDETAKWIMKRG